MRTLLIESTPGIGRPVADALEAGHHDVARCREEFGLVFPCAGLSDAGCPLDGDAIDVVVGVRSTTALDPTADEAGITCALRQGVPVLIVADAHDDSYGNTVERCPTGGDVAEACRSAVAASANRRAEPISTEVARLLDAEGLDPTGVRVDVERQGGTVTIRIDPGTPIPGNFAGVLATRAHAVDQRGTWPGSIVNIEVDTATAARAEGDGG